MSESVLLFEAHVYTVQLVWPLIIFGLLVIGSAVAALPFTPWEPKRLFRNWKPFLTLFSVILALTFFGYTCVFFREMVPYFTGKYEIVEGDVEDFHVPISIYARDNESFRIGDVRFSYSPGIITFGYHSSTFRDNCVIRPGMQNLRIAYVTDAVTGENIIMRVEQLPYDTYKE